MNMKRIGIILAGFVVAAFAAPAFADPPAPAPGPAPAGKPSAQPNWQDKDVRHLVHVIMMARLAEELNLSDEETVKLVRRFEEHRVKLERNANERRRASDDLKAAIKDKVSDDAVKEKLEKLKALDAEQFELRRDTVKEVSVDMTPASRRSSTCFSTTSRTTCGE